MIYRQRFKPAGKFAGSMAAPAGLICAMIGREFYEVVTDPEKLAWRRTIASRDRKPITQDQPPPAPQPE